MRAAVVALATVLALATGALGTALGPMAEDSVAGLLSDLWDFIWGETAKEATSEQEWDEVLPDKPWHGRAAQLMTPCMESAPDAPPFAYCNMSLSTEARAKDLVSRLNLHEKSVLLSNTAGSVKSLGLSGYQWWNEALHGVANSPGVKFRPDGVKAATSFPQVLTTAQSLNRTLFSMIGAAIGTEARAMANARQAGLTYWTPNINIFRDPRWGRGQETPGEDPKVNGDYAEAFVRAFQEDPRDPTRLKASACCKHFAAYNLEAWGGVKRENFDAKVSPRDMHETYLPAFEACVRRGKVSSLMCSYNAINGVPSCANKELLLETARKEWGFEGYITGDCGAVANLYNQYHYKDHDESELVRDALDATTDIACDNYLRMHVVDSVRAGVTPESLVDSALVNLFQVQIRLGYFDSDAAQPFRRIGTDAIDTAAHRQLALEAARQGMVLLKNADKTLPLSAAGSKVVLTGPHAKSSETMLGNYFGDPPFIVTIEQGLRDMLGKDAVTVLPGCDLSRKQSPEAQLAAAEEAARSASQTVLAVGIDQAQEREGVDRQDLLLPGRQNELVTRVSKAAKEAGKPPVVIVVLAGGTVDLSAALADDGVGAILWAGYPGQSGGTAIAETLFGHNNPSGRLTQTFYPNSFTKKVNMMDMDMHPRGKEFPGRTYRFYKGDVVFPFGFGLSYSTFEYEVVRKNTRASGSTVVAVRVRNAGAVAGQHVLMAFLAPPGNASLRRKLLAYERTPTLAPGESHELEVTVAPEDLRLFASAGDTAPRAVDGTWRLELHDGTSTSAQASVALERQVESQN